MFIEFLHIYIYIYIYTYTYVHLPAEHVSTHVLNGLEPYQGAPNNFRDLV